MCVCVCVCVCVCGIRASISGLFTKTSTRSIDVFKFVLSLTSALWFFTINHIHRGLSPLSVPQVRIKTRIRDGLIAS